MLSLYRLFMRIADNYAAQFRLTLIYTVLSATVQSLAYLTLLPVVTDLYYHAHFSSILPWLYVLILLLILQIIFKLNEWKFTYRHWHKLIEEKRLALGQVLYDMPLLKLKKYDSGELVEVIGSNVMTLVSALNQIGTLFVQLITIPVILLVASVLISWQLGLLLVLACLMMYPVFQLAKARQKSGYQAINQADSECAARTIEYIQGLTVFKASGQTGKNAFRLQQALSRQHHSQHEVHDSLKKPVFISQAILQVALMAVILLGSVLMYYAAIDAASLAVMVILTVYLSESLGIIAVVNALFANAEASQKKIDNILAEKSLNQATQAADLHDFTVQFNQVSFAYQQKPVLQNINLLIKQNTITGVVGASGSGKTTLVQLISGFIMPDSGTITIDGYDIRRMSSKHLLSYISIVYQDVWLFNDTIRNNILMGNPHASEEQVYQAARAANIHEFILTLPQQYDTVTGDIGAFLSGGEKQRISIARAILKNAPLVILDEPTSSLDSASEYQVQQALDALVKDKTVIVIAHRLSTVKGADTIIVLENGSIIQQGDHRALISETGSLYQRLWQAQLCNSQV